MPSLPTFDPGQSRPRLSPALRHVWRDPTTVQLGVDPQRAVVIGGLDEADTTLLHALDGTRRRAELLAEVEELGISLDRAGALLELLDDAGVLEDATLPGGRVARLPLARRDQLAPDLAAAALRYGVTDGGRAVLSRRATAYVAIHGAGRVGATVASLLAAAGVGTVTVHDRRPVLPSDVAPAGIAEATPRRTRESVLRSQLRAAWPTVRTIEPLGRRPAVAVLAADDGVADLPGRLLRDGVPHLVARVLDVTGIVGPLVLPGRSSCLRCHDLHRSDRDPSWPAVAAQLSDAAGGSRQACDIVLATTVAAHAAGQVLALLAVDCGGDPPLTVDGTLELGSGDTHVRRREWTLHPACGCGWALPALARQLDPQRNRQG